MGSYISYLTYPTAGEEGISVGMDTSTSTNTEVEV